MIPKPAGYVWAEGKMRGGVQTITRHRAGCGVVWRARSSLYSTVFLHAKRPGNLPWYVFVDHRCVRGAKG